MPTITTDNNYYGYVPDGYRPYSIYLQQRDEARRWARKMKRERDELKEEYEHIRELYINSNKENARLRELIKQVEFCANDTCPFCLPLNGLAHSPSCPAFGENGIVKE